MEARCGCSALVNDYPDRLNNAVKEVLHLPEDVPVQWLSPLRDDQYAEYSDQDFINHLGTVLNQRPLDPFWPDGGPEWDALGRTGRDELLLVEAKAHIREVVSSPTGAQGGGLDDIITSLQETQAFFNADMRIDWSRNFYQFANRLAHLYLLRDQNKLPAFLVMIYFVGDPYMQGPTTKEEWQGAIKLLKQFLRVDGNPFMQYQVDLFFDVAHLPPPERDLNGLHPANPSSSPKG